MMPNRPVQSLRSTSNEDGFGHEDEEVHEEIWQMLKGCCFFLKRFKNMLICIGIYLFCFVYWTSVNILIVPFCYVEVPD